MTLSKNFLTSTHFLIFVALGMGIAAGLMGGEATHAVCENISTIYINFLKLVSTPLIFLSICSTLSGISGFREVRTLGTRVMSYTVVTTLIAAAIGLLLFLLIHPVLPVGVGNVPESVAIPAQASYQSFLMGLFPSNFVEAFLKNNVIAIMLIAFLTGFATLALEGEQRIFLKNLFSSLFDVVIKMTEYILKFIPLAVFAFVALFVKDQVEGFELGALGAYFITILSANLIQAAIVLPLLLKLKGYSPLRVMKGYMPALTLAFFSKSSNAALPTTLRCAQQNLGVSKRVSNFSLPLCVTCNMNACAAFILITVLFVATSNGMTFSATELLAWIFLATLAAIGNAGVPMGCYFLATAFLTALDVPLNIMGLILPLYAFLDMVETAVNVWSDGVITVVAEKDLQSERPVLKAA
ncbi:MAG: dicarboxylate/amino acid:cation symporter [Pseudomonadota bacterium]